MVRLGSGELERGDDVLCLEIRKVGHLIRVLDIGGEAAAADLAAKLGDRFEVLTCNGLVPSWPEIARLAGEAAGRAPGPGELFDEVQ